MIRRLLLPALLGLLACVAPACAADPDALWKIVNGRCVPDQQQHQSPLPCLTVDLSDGVARGSAVLKDLVGATQLLLIATARLTGIESPELLAPDAVNYFAAAWRARPLLDALAKRTLPRDAVSLAINSVSGRSQNQLHIHIDCLDAAVRETLRAEIGGIGDRWAPLGVKLAGHFYQAMRVAGETLDEANPFLLLAEGLPTASADMGHQTLVVAGAMMPDGRPGFILLTDHANPLALDFGSGEDLQDHACHGY